MEFQVYSITTSKSVEKTNGDIEISLYMQASGPTSIKDKTPRLIYAVYSRGITVMVVRSYAIRRRTVEKTNRYRYRMRLR